MKKLLLSISLLLTLPLSLQAAPKPDTKYLGVKLGLSQLRSDFCNTRSKLPVGGILAGRQLNAYLAVEYGYDYIFHDKIETELDCWSNSSTSRSYHGIPVIAKLSTSIMESQFDLFARLGCMITIRNLRNEVTVKENYNCYTPFTPGSITTINVSVSPFLAAGLEYTFVPDWAARLDYQWIPGLDKNTGNHMVTFGMTYRFKQAITNTSLNACLLQQSLKALSDTWL